jgi:hypothetical protein
MDQGMSWFVDALRHNPELAIFLTLALGACVRAGTITALLRAPQEELQSKTPYAVVNILLTAWRPVLVATMAAGR